MRRLRGIAMIVGALLAVGAGLYFGEDLIVFYPSGLIVAVGVALGVGALLTPGGGGVRIVGAVMLLLPLLAGFAAGRYEGTTAFQESVDRAEALQAALAAHREAAGAFPASLEALSGFELPGRRLLRGRAIDYVRTAAGYRLVTRRWSLRFVGDERKALAPEEGAP